VPEAQSKLSFMAQFREQVPAKVGNCSPVEFYPSIQSGMMVNAIVRLRVVKEEAIDVIEPSPFDILRRIRMREAEDMPLAHVTHALGDLLRSRAELWLDQFREPLEVKSAVDQDGDSPNSHTCVPEKGSPRFLLALRIVERAYSRGRMWHG